MLLKENCTKMLTLASSEYGLLKQIRSMVSRYEVEACALWQWELAILKGFEVFRQLYAERRGIVHVDLEAHSMRFESLTIYTS